MSGTSAINPTLVPWKTKSGTEVVADESVNQEPTLILKGTSRTRVLKAWATHFGNENYFTFDTLDRKTPILDRSSFSSYGLTTTVTFKIFSQIPASVQIEFFQGVKKHSLTIKHEGAGLQVFNVSTDLLKTVSINNDDNSRGVTVSAKGTDQISLVGPIIFERDPRDSHIFNDIVARLNPVFGKESRSLLRTIIRNLFNPEAVAYALSVGQNKKLTEKFLKENDLSLYEITKKISADKFFGRHKDVLPDWRVVPVEGSSFATEHGSYSHMYQLIAATYGVDKVTREKIVNLFLRAFQSNNIALWRVWDTLFDGTGSRLPTTPRYWRDAEEG